VVNRYISKTNEKSAKLCTQNLNLHCQVCTVHSPWSTLSRVCRVQGLSCPGFVVSRVCRVQGLSCPGFVVSRVCLSRVCRCIRVSLQILVVNFLTAPANWRSQHWGKAFSYYMQNGGGIRESLPVSFYCLDRPL
jgi:hypothetical protein